MRTTPYFGRVTRAIKKEKPVIIP